MVAPKAPIVRCDVPGCGMPADTCTDGTEIDIQDLDRPSIADINVCNRHGNWPHSADAERFATSDAYRERIKG